MFFIKYLNQEILCPPTGADCFTSVRIPARKCLLPCRGLYADVAEDNSDLRNVEDMRNFDSLRTHYEEYKRANSNAIVYPIMLKGKALFSIQNPNFDLSFLILLLWTFSYTFLLRL